MFIHTLNSVYEVDAAQQRVRRLIGNGHPTERVGESWREYARLDVDAGLPMIIIWEYVTDENGQHIAKSTVTSKVTSIVEKAQPQ